MSCQIAKTEYWKIMIWLSDTKCCHLAIHYVLPKDRPGPNLHFRFMINCIHTSLLFTLDFKTLLHWNENFSYEFSATVIGLNRLMFYDFWTNILISDYCVWQAEWLTLHYMSEIDFEWNLFPHPKETYFSAQHILPLIENWLFLIIFYSLSVPKTETKSILKTLKRQLYNKKRLDRLSENYIQPCTPKWFTLGWFWTNKQRNVVQNWSKSQLISKKNWNVL